MRKKRSINYKIPFFGAYFFYYSAYCLFSSYLVLFLTRMGYSASSCGVITSLTLIANLLVEPLGGYITDTFLSTRKYLLFCLGAVFLLNFCCTSWMKRPFLLVPGLILFAGITYPFSQLMDAWVEICRKKQPDLVYSQIRAGGSIGYALTSVLCGYYFQSKGWESYFLLQSVMFLLLIPFLLLLPNTELGNTRKKEKNRQLTFGEAIKELKGNKNYLFCLAISTVYWLSHRPVGSFLSLIVEERGGDPGIYGGICGVGAVIESAALLFLGRWRTKSSSSPFFRLGAALFMNLLRPLCLFCCFDVWALYLGQILQSVSFALFYSAVVECFSLTSDERIRSFSISSGLTVSSVVGTALANVIGGEICDRFMASSVVIFSLILAAVNFFCFLILSEKLKIKKN